MKAIPPVTVIVPVYRGLDDVTRCLHSVMHHAGSAETEFRLLVIDDASPDDDVRAYLDHLAHEPAAVPVELLRNEENLGFVRTVNRGLRRAEGDVVILNADTALTAGWLDRVAAAARLPDVATVTPLTNHGSICTLPQPVIDAFELDGPSPRIDECAAFVTEQSPRVLPEVITGVGFCMYTTKAALDLCGLLDEEAFGVGYGEEVDFCLRATRLGLRHLVEDSTFVYHRGGGSFGEYQREGLNRSSAILDHRYPFFRPSNMSERARDPLEITFTALTLGLSERSPDRPHVLHLLHSPPGQTGGTEKFVQSLMNALADEFDFSVLYPIESGFVLRTFWNVDGAPIEQEFLLPGAFKDVTRIHDEVAGAALALALDIFEVDAVHLHNLIGHSLAALTVLADFAGPVSSSVHDLYLACPNFSLLYKKHEACGIPEDLSVCERCLETISVSPMPGAAVNRGLSLPYLEAFRAEVATHLSTVDHWVFATQSAADYFLRAYEPEPDRVEIIEHGATIDLAGRDREPDETLIYDEPLRVGFAGLGWAKKGLLTVNDLAEAFRDSPIELHHFGAMKETATPEVHAHGPYDNEYLPELLRRAGIQVVLLPGAYAETFGIVMTEALATGLPVIGAHYGALGERIRAHGVGWTIDPMDVDGIRALIERLDRCRDEVMRATREAAAVRLFPVDATAHRYAELYRRSEAASSAERTRVSA